MNRLMVLTSRNQGHTAVPKKPGAPDSPAAILDTRRYLRDFDRAKNTAKSDQDLFDQMTALYPDWAANQSSLKFGFPGV